MTLEIPTQFWNQFCQKLTTLQDVLMDIRIQAEGDLRLVVQGAVLRSMEFEEANGGCTTGLTIEFSQADGRPAQHHVVEPIRLILRRDPAGDSFNLLEMPAESGVTVIVFRPGIRRSWLEELEIPGQRALPDPA